MTIRALILGLLGAAFIAGVGYLNDSLLELTKLVGNHLPVSVFGILILMVIVLNPLLGLVRGSWRFRPGELAVIVALMLVACSIATGGLMRTFVPGLALPAQENTKRPAWQRAGVLDYTPGVMLANDGQYDRDKVHAPLMAGGAPDSSREIGLGDVPWPQWREALWTWIPLVFLVGVAVICLSLIVHSQWSLRERLRYPIVEFAKSLTDAEPGGGAKILRSKLFWIGLGIVLAIHVINGLTAWKVMQLEIPLFIDLSVVRAKWPLLGQAPGAWGMFVPRLLPAVAAFSFFLASDVALTLGLSHILYAAVALVLIGQGVEIKGSETAGNPTSWQYFGSCLGIALMAVYTGRRYYWGVLKQALTLRRQPGVESHAAWAARIGLVATIVIVGILVVRLGLNWPFAVLLVGLLLMLFLVMARINVESGLIFIQLNWEPLAVFAGLFGAAALGPRAFMVLAMLSLILAHDPRECLMPFMLNGLKLSADTGVKPARVSGFAVVALAVALAVAVPVVLWASYNFGVSQTDQFAFKSFPTVPFVAGEKVVRDLKDPLPGALNLKQSESLGTWGRIAAIRPDGRFIAYAGLGLALVLALSVVRLRYTWWPLHPILFVVWGTYPLVFLYPSFLAGWLIKGIVTKLGGGKTYNQVKPLMIGVIAGDLLGGAVFMIAGAAYYGVYNEMPPGYAGTWPFG